MQWQISCKKTDPSLIRFYQVNALQLLLCTLKYDKKLNFYLRIGDKYVIMLWC